MKKFIFSLEKVLGFKQQTLDVKKNEFAALQAQMHDLERQIHELNLNFKQSNEKMVEEMKEGLTSNHISNYKIYFNTLNDKIKKLLAVKKQLAEVIELKKQEIVSLNSEISGLEKLKDKQWQEYAKCLQKSQELAIEEFISQSRSFAH